MELTIDKRKVEINNNYKLNLSYWDLCFWQNNPIHFVKFNEISSKLQFVSAIKLQELYGLVDAKNFIIDANSQDINRYYSLKSQRLKAQGECNTIFTNPVHADYAKATLAKKFGDKQYEEYKTLVDYLKTTNYPNTFKCLLLNEALHNIYQMNTIDNQPKLIVKHRQLGQSIYGMMNLPIEVIDYIYNNAPNYNSFKTLYVDSQLYYKDYVTNLGKLDLGNVETFNKGRWIKFSSQTNDPQNYDKNCVSLQSLILNTPWCTKNMGKTHLSEGDFYVFIDNDNVPHIAIKMNGNEIDEVRGIKNGNAQELEDNYRDVLINFIQNNVDIKCAQDWLNKEEWNERLVRYNKKIIDHSLSQNDIPQLLNDLLYKDYKIHMNYQNSNLSNLKGNLPLIAKEIALYYGCREEELCFGNYQPSDEDVCPYCVIFCNAKFAGIKSIDKLQIVYGDVDFDDCLVNIIPKLEFIQGDVHFSGSKIVDLNTLKSIGGTAYFAFSLVKDTGQLEDIGGFADFAYSDIECLKNIISIGGNVDFKLSKLTDLGNLESIGGFADFSGLRLKSLGKLSRIKKDAIFKSCAIENWGDLQTIEGTLDLQSCIVNSPCTLKSANQIIVDNNTKINYNDLSFCQCNIKNVDKDCTPSIDI